MSQKIAPGKWSADERMEARSLLVKAGMGLIVIGIVPMYMLAVPALQRDVTLWSLLLTAPFALLLVAGVLALMKGVGFDLVPMAKYLIDRFGKDAPNVRDE